MKADNRKKGEFGEKLAQEFLKKQKEDEDLQSHCH